MHSRQGSSVDGDKGLLLLLLATSAGDKRLICVSCRIKSLLFGFRSVKWTDFCVGSFHQGTRRTEWSFAERSSYSACSRRAHTSWGLLARTTWRHVAVLFKDLKLAWRGARHGAATGLSRLLVSRIVNRNHFAIRRLVMRGSKVTGEFGRAEGGKFNKLCLAFGV